MSKNKKKYLTDDEGNQYYILNNEKIYVKEITSCVDFFEYKTTEKEKNTNENFIKESKKNMLQKIICSLLDNNNKH